MIKNFIFTWYAKPKYGDKIIRTNTIKSKSPKEATDAFMKTFGNLKKNVIVSIQENDAEGNPVGEPITSDQEEKEEDLKN